MLESKIEIKNGKPILYVNGEPTSAMAYTTYFAERSCADDFIEAGYRIFFVNVSLTSAPINSVSSGFTPFCVGVFEDMENPDYSEFEGEVRKILDICPDAVIFPRIYASMPRSWINSHPSEAVPTKKGGMREALFSEAYRTDCSKMIKTLVEHIKSADYESRIGGWQLCGGQTQEWMHHDLNGSLSPSAEGAFSEWMRENYGKCSATLPSPEEFYSDGATGEKSDIAKAYTLFCNEEVTKTIDIFASVIKEATNNSQIVGTFYGYSFENCVTVLFGSHALRKILDSKNIDFYSSPNAYAENRRFGIDWADMMPTDSVKHHGKLCFIECDIRTYLTSAVQDARPGTYPDDIYRTEDGKSVWAGPPTADLSKKALRKSFAHQITKASAIWWFDMWGGWYKDPVLMSELREMKLIYDKEPERVATGPSPEVVFFADERGYAELFSDSPELASIEYSRTAVGITGVPHDTFMVEDAGKILKRYKAAIFPMPRASEAGRRAMKLCDEMNIPYLTSTGYSLGAEEIRAFYDKCGIHEYAKFGEVVYLGNGYIGLHSAAGGAKRLKLPKGYTAKAVFGAKDISQSENTLEFYLEECDTALFAIFAS